MTASLAADRKPKVSASLPPDRVVALPLGGAEEQWDIPLVTGSHWVEGPSKAVQLDELEAADVASVGTLVKLYLDLFAGAWETAVFGPRIEGAIFDLRLESEPRRVSVLDGYPTVFPRDSGPAHSHLCIAPRRGFLNNPVPPEFAAIRKRAKATFYRTPAAGTRAPGSRGIRLENGRGEQMVTFFLPSPWLDVSGHRQPADFRRLALRDTLRARYLGETVPQPPPAEHGDVHGWRGAPADPRSDGLPGMPGAEPARHRSGRAPVLVPLNAGHQGGGEAPARTARVHVPVSPSRDRSGGQARAAAGAFHANGSAARASAPARGAPPTPATLAVSRALPRPYLLYI